LANRKLIVDFTGGNIPKQLFVFMLPFMASNGLQVLYNLVDMLIVGRYVGPAGLTGVSQGGQVVAFATLLCMGFSNSGQIMIAQLIGADRRDQLRSVIGTLFSLMFLLGAALSVLILTQRRRIIALLNVDTVAVRMTEEYLIVCGSGLLFMCGYNIVSTILRGMGDSRHPFIFITAASVLNLLLDLLLTGRLGMGVMGAAIATVVSQAISFLASIAFLSRHQDAFYFDFRPASFLPDRKYLKEMLRLGVPFALQSASVNLSVLVCNSFVNRLGVIASATFGVGIKVEDIGSKLAMGVQYAAAPMIGQNSGARKFDRMRSVVYWTWVMCGVVFLLFFLAYKLAGREIFALFTDDPDVLKLSAVFISAIIWCFPGMVLMRGTNSFMQGIGNSRLIFCFAMIDAGLRAALSYLFGITMGMGFFGFVLGFAMAPYGISIPGAIYFFSGAWTKRRSTADLAEPPAPAD